MARLLEKVAAAEPRVTALDVLYSEPAVMEDDRALAEAVARAGRVVVAAQLIEEFDVAGHRRVEWLRPLAEIERAAAGVGHVNIFTGNDGVARALALRQADNKARGLWALAIETVRVGDRAAPEDLREADDAVWIGARRVAINADDPPISAGAVDAGASFDTWRVAWLSLDYVGPTGAFAANTYSFGDVLDGRVPPEKLRGKYVLIGATATALGDRIASPFTQAQSADGRQRAELMPGVEVLANTLHTILRERFHRELPDWMALLCAALAAAMVVLLLALAQGRMETIKQIAALAGGVALILLAAYVAFVYWLIALPLAPMLVACAVAAPLALLRRSLAMSAGLNARIGELAQADVSHLFSAGPYAAKSSWPDPARAIARWSGAEAVAIFARRSGDEEGHRLIGGHGTPVQAPFIAGHAPGLDELIAGRRSIAQAKAELDPPARYFSFAPDDPAVAAQEIRALVVRLGEGERAAGALIIACANAQRLADETLLVCREAATGYLIAVAQQELQSGLNRRRRVWWPRGAEWKAHVLGALHRRMLARTRFVKRALRSIEDGLLVTAADGGIVFANPRAAAILGLPERSLIGGDLFAHISGAERGGNGIDGAGAADEMLFRLLVERAPVEREITVGDSPARHYVLRLSAVSDWEDEPKDKADGKIDGVLGIVATLSDITRQRELQQTKNDVMTLVSHELRTPLTAIQAMSEVLSKHDFDDARRREMHAAINDETKRLARMIDEYLDITRLESGARPLQPSPARAAALIEQALRLLDPIAAQRGVSLERRFAPNLPPLVADADLIARAVTNLAANAVKFSPARGVVTVTARVEGGALLIEVRDHGCGIPAESLGRIFEKFYRVPRVEEADAPGTGLGLAFVREIMELHGGRVTVESEVGTGSVFTLRLPLPQQEMTLRDEA